MATGNQPLPHTHYPMGRIAVMGAGAVGSYYRYKLARAARDVMLIVRPQLVEVSSVRGSGSKPKPYTAYRELAAFGG